MHVVNQIAEAARVLDQAKRAADSADAATGDARADWLGRAANYARIATEIIDGIAAAEA